MTETGAHLPPLREVIARHELAAKKSFGQNFILDLNLTRRIARAVPNIENSLVFEIGPGPGGLTRALLMEGAKQVFAVEADARCQPALEEIQDAYKGRFQFAIGDALNLELKILAERYEHMPIHICANLPYNVGTALLTSWMTSEEWPPCFKSLTLMFQKEVAERISAREGTKAFGRLAVLCNWRSTTRILFNVSPSAFSPPPKVSSSVVQIIPADPILPELKMKALGKLTEIMFGQRRKMLRASLKKLGPSVPKALRALNLDDTLRPEALTIRQTAALALELQNQLC